MVNFLYFLFFLYFLYIKMLSNSRYHHRLVHSMRLSEVMNWLTSHQIDFSKKMSKMQLSMLLSTVLHQIHPMRIIIIYKVMKQNNTTPSSPAETAVVTQAVVQTVEKAKELVKEAAENPTTQAKEVAKQAVQEAIVATKALTSVDPPVEDNTTVAVVANQVVNDLTAASGALNNNSPELAKELVTQAVKELDELEEHKFCSKIMEYVGDKTELKNSEYNLLINDQDNPMTNDEMDACLKKHNITIPKVHALKKGKQKSLQGAHLLIPPPPQSLTANILDINPINQVTTPNYDPRALSNSTTNVLNEVEGKKSGKRNRKNHRRSNKRKANRSKNNN